MLRLGALIVGDAYLNHAVHLAPPPGDHTPPDTRARDVALHIGFVCDALGLDAGVLAAAVRARATVVP